MRWKVIWGCAAEKPSRAEERMPGAAGLYGLGGMGVEGPKQVKEQRWGKQGSTQAFCASSLH